MSAFALSTGVSTLRGSDLSQILTRKIAMKMDYSALSDEELFNEFQNGDSEAINILLIRSTTKFAQITRTLIKNRQLAEEALQEALILIIRKAGTFKNQAKFSTWAYRIVHNACIDLLRKESVRFTKDNTAELANIEQDVSSTFESDSVERILIEQSLNQLSQEHSQVLRLVYVGGYSIEECAELLDVPIGTVKSRCDRAKKAFSGAYQAVSTTNGTNSVPSTSKRVR